MDLVLKYAPSAVLVFIGVIGFVLENRRWKFYCLARDLGKTKRPDGVMGLQWQLDFERFQRNERYYSTWRNRVAYVACTVLIGFLVYKEYMKG